MIKNIRKLLGLSIRFIGLIYMFWILVVKFPLFFVAFYDFNFYEDVLSTWGAGFMIKLVITLLFFVPAILLYKIGNLVEGRDWDYWFDDIIKRFSKE